MERFPKVITISKKKKKAQSSTEGSNTATPWTTSNQDAPIQWTTMSNKVTPTDGVYQKPLPLMSSVASENDDIVLKESSSPPREIKPVPKTGKSKCLKGLGIAAVILVVLCALAGLGIGIYFLVQNTTTTSTTSTTSTQTLGLRWNPMATTVAGTGGPGVTTDRLNAPYHLAIDSSDALYVADFSNHRVQKFTSGSPNGVTILGQPNGVAGNTLSGLTTPSYLLLDWNRNLYVSDTGNHRVLMFHNSTAPGTLIAGTGIAGLLFNQLNTPRGLAQDPSTGTMYISDMLNHRVMGYPVGATVGTVAAGGNGTGTLNTQLCQPIGLYFDVTSNSLFIASYTCHNIFKWVLGASSGTVVAGSASGLPSNLPTALNGPTGVTFDSMGNMYVADSINYRIQFFSNGQLNGTTVAGLTNSFGNMPNLFYNPYAVAFDSQMNMYVADTSNHRIQKFQRY